MFEYAKTFLQKAAKVVAQAALPDDPENKDSKLS
jgi:hypothetical protein